MRENKNESSGKSNQGSMNNFKKTNKKFQQVKTLSCAFCCLLL